jgi:hypothetical protein
MTALAVHRPAARPAVAHPATGEAAMRAALRAQIARLEPQVPIGSGARSAAGGRRGAALVTLAELERIRDDLVWRVGERRFSGGAEQERMRRLREELWLDPQAHVGVTVANADVGEPGCTRWSSWFRLRISGGCP